MADDVQGLVERAQAGDREAFARIYDHFAALVRSIAYDITGSMQESDDLCQDVFLTAYRKLGQLRDTARFTPWLVSICRHACSTWQRNRPKRSTVRIDDVDAPGGVSDCLEGNEPDFSTAEDVERVLEAIRRLPPTERTALHLFYLVEQPAAAARETLGLSHSGFYKVLERARRQVAAIMESRKVMR